MKKEIIEVARFEELSNFSYDDLVEFLLKEDFENVVGASRDQLEESVWEVLMDYEFASNSEIFDSLVEHDNY